MKPNDSKLWRLRYRFDDKQKDLALGRYSDVSLAAAREKRAEAKALLAQGTDPRAHEDAAKEEARAISEDTFGRIAAEVLEKRAKEAFERERDQSGAAPAWLSGHPYKPRFPRERVQPVE